MQAVQSSITRKVSCFLYRRISLPTEFPLTPLTIVVPLAAALPSLQDNTADIDRLKATLAASLPQQLAEYPVRIPFRCLATLGKRFRKTGFKGYAVVHILADRLDLIDFLPKKPKVLPAVALDLGSTHLEASLLDFLTGTVLARSTAVNLQVEYGADILSRIHFAEKGKGADTLQQAVVGSINALIDNLCEEANARAQDIRAISVAGNTTMVHLLLGLSPRHICREPYIPLVNAPDPFRAEEIGLCLHPQAIVWILPSKGSYFGGDLIAGILTAGLDQAEETAMLIDMGTNAEVVLGSREWLIACAGAAGPALEGGVARMGMRAAAGAIEHVAIDREHWQLSRQTVNNSLPVGICGSGLIDLAAELYLARVIDLRGRFQRKCPDRTAEQENFIRQHLLERNGETTFLLASAEESGTDEPVVIGQIDLDAMMRSKAAMYAILETLTAQVGVEFSDIERIYVAGAFGKHIDPRQAITLGMLPDLPPSRFKPVGNSSLRGAEVTLLNQGARKRAGKVAQKITYIELNVNQEFMNRFSGAKFIPHTEPDLFPSVPIFR